MALKTSWTSTDISNRLVVEDFQVRYATEEVYYEIAPKGDPSQTPSYVTDAETAVETASTNLNTAKTEKEALEPNVTTAQNEKDAAYSTWYANKTISNYQAYNAKRISYTTVLSQYEDKIALVTKRTREYNTALNNLEKANDRWAVERESVYYKGARKIGFLYHRYATLRLKYVGFSVSAATACRNALETYYTRTITKTSSFNDGVVEELTQTYNPSSIKASQAEGDNYTVDVDITEEDVHASTTLVSPSSLFTEENARHYFIDQEVSA